MNIGIVHYHLNRGGVTKVIQHHLASLDSQLPAGEALDVCVFFGGRCDGLSPGWETNFRRLSVSLRPLGELDYDNVRPRRDDLAGQLETALARLGWSPDETVLHFHNHSLGKNTAVPAAVARLADRGYGLLLQIHDFAEDFRPDSYRAIVDTLGAGRLEAAPAQLYPQADHIHYAILNGRDYRVLADAGVDAARLHWLPNPVPAAGALPPRADARSRLAQHAGIAAAERFVLYPVRGIRRKNVGEALLWSALADSQTRFGLTLPPQNPVEQPAYQRWKSLATQLGLPWHFELGCNRKLEFEDILAGADTVLTTSVAEGFGLAFLECWLAHSPLTGRDLPEITADFVNDGMNFPDLQPHLLVPFDLLDADAFYGEVIEAYQQVLSAYGEPAISAAQLRSEIEDWIVEGRIDFARCGVAAQSEIIKQVSCDKGCREEVLGLNPWIRDTLTFPARDEIIEANASIVRQQYSLAVCGQRLHRLYRDVVSSPRGGRLRCLDHGNIILERFLSLVRFNALRVQS